MSESFNAYLNPETGAVFVVSTNDTHTSIVFSDTFKLTTNKTNAAEQDVVLSKQAGIWSIAAISASDFLQWLKKLNLGLGGKGVKEAIERAVNNGKGHGNLAKVDNAAVVKLANALNELGVKQGLMPAKSVVRKRRSSFV